MVFPKPKVDLQLRAEHSEIKVASGRPEAVESPYHCKAQAPRPVRRAYLIEVADPVACLWLSALGIPWHLFAASLSGCATPSPIRCAAASLMSCFAGPCFVFARS